MDPDLDPGQRPHAPSRRSVVADDVDRRRPRNDVQKRIDKVVYERNTERGQRLALAEENARLRRELAEIRRKEKQAARAQSLTDDPELRQIDEELDAAAKDADTMKLAEATRKRQDYLARRVVAAHAEPEDDDDEQPPAPASGGKPPLAPAARAWLDKQDWWGKDEARTKRAIEINNRLREQRGYSPADPELYEELDRELARASKRQARAEEDEGEDEESEGGDDWLGEEEDESAGGEDDDEPAGGGADYAGDFRQVAERRRAPARRYQRAMSRDDLRAMRMAGLDPNSQRDREIFVDRNRLE